MYGFDWKYDVKDDRNRSATERLRDMLDKRKIKWEQGPDYDLPSYGSGDETYKPYVDSTHFSVWFTDWKALDCGNGCMALRTTYRTIRPDDIIRGLVDSYVSTFYRPRHDSRIEKENQRLRELVETMHDYYVSGEVQECDVCKWHNECRYEVDGYCRYDDIRENAAKEYFATNFAELGIEVDG